METSTTDPVTELNDLCILEIGHQHFCKSQLPEQTNLIWTGVKPDRPAVDGPVLTLSTFPRLWWSVGRGDHNVIVVYVEQWAPWHWKSLLRIVSRHPIKIALKLAFIQAMRLMKPRCPLVVIDLTEWGFIHRYNEFLLDICVYWFKREIPIDRWRVFRRSAGGGFPGTRFRRNPRNRRRIEKLRPLSLGCSAIDVGESPFPVKSADVFVAGTIWNSATVRVEGYRQLAALRERGIKIDFAENRLDHREFMARMSKAWLTWSPAGFGWDCFRHYEAPLAHSVPVMSAPTIVRQFPLLDGIHCFYYFQDEPEALGKTLAHALEDKERLARMAQAARSLVIRHHLWPHRIEALLAMAMGREVAPGGLSLEPTFPK